MSRSLSDRQKGLVQEARSFMDGWSDRLTRYRDGIRQVEICLLSKRTGGVFFALKLLTNDNSPAIMWVESRS